LDKARTQRTAKSSAGFAGSNYMTFWITIDVGAQSTLAARQFARKYMYEN